MIVVDASALIEVLLRTPAAIAVDRWLFDSRRTLYAPHLLDIEVAQVVRRYAAKGEIDGERGQHGSRRPCRLSFASISARVSFAARLGFAEQSYGV